MGYYFGSNKAAWTFFVIVYTSVSAATQDDTLLNDLGLVLPDKAKINISLEEYTATVKTYLSKKDDSFEAIPDLRVYKLDTLSKQDTNRRPLKMVFPVPLSSDVIESAALRLLVPPQHSKSDVIKIHISQILGTRRAQSLGEETLYLSRNFTKWCELDVTTAVASWSRGHRNLGLEIACVGCSNNINPIEAAITALVHKAQRRIKRSLSKGITDCSARHHNGKGKKRCCRHEMNVTFTKLGFREMKNIVEPKTFEAGYCQGMCPANYNLATNHSRIQGLMHQLDKRNAKLFKNKTMLVPKTCCAPSKLGDLEVLIVDSQDSTKLKMETWQNMRVLECACS